MTPEENKRVVLDYLATGDPALIHEDMSWWTPGTGAMDRAGFLRLIEPVMPQFASRTTMTVDHVTAEDDRVAVEFRGRGELVDGRVYENSYHFLYLMRDGRILQQREHADSAYACAVLGPKLVEILRATETRPVPAAGATPA